MWNALVFERNCDIETKIEVSNMNMRIWWQKVIFSYNHACSAWPQLPHEATHILGYVSQTLLCCMIMWMMSGIMLHFHCRWCSPTRLPCIVLLYHFLNKWDLCWIVQSMTSACWYPSQEQYPHWCKCQYMLM